MAVESLTEQKKAILGGDELAEKLREYSREKFGMDRQTVEDEIYRRLRT